MSAPIKAVADIEHTPTPLPRLDQLHLMGLDHTRPRDTDLPPTTPPPNTTTPQDT